MNHNFRLAVATCELCSETSAVAWFLSLHLRFRYGGLPCSVIHDCCHFVSGVSDYNDALMLYWNYHFVIDRFSRGHATILLQNISSNFL